MIVHFTYNGVQCAAFRKKNAESAMHTQINLKVFMSLTLGFAETSFLSGESCLQSTQLIHDNIRYTYLIISDLWCKAASCFLLCFLK